MVSLDAFWVSFIWVMKCVGKIWLPLRILMGDDGAGFCN